MTFPALENHVYDTFTYFALIHFQYGSVRQRTRTCSQNLNYLADHASDTFVLECTEFCCEPCWIDKSNSTATQIVAVKAILAYHAFSIDECAYGDLIVPWCESPNRNEPHPTATWIIAVTASFVSLCTRIELWVCSKHRTDTQLSRQPALSPRR